MQYSNSHCWRHGGRRADGRCIACSQLMTLSSECTCWSSPVTNDAQYRQGSDDQSPDLQDDCESTDASRKSSLLSAHSDDGTTASRRVSSDELTASCVTSAEECVVVEEMEPSRQSSLLSAAGEQSVNGHSVECCKTHQLFTVSSAHHNQQYLDVTQVSSNESLLSAKGSYPDNIGRRLISDACQSTTIGSNNSSRQFSLLSTVREQSLDSHSIKGHCKFHQRCCDNRQHTNQLVKQVSSSEVSLLSAKGSNPNNDDWRVNDGCQFNGVGYCEITTKKSLSRSIPLNNHTTKKHHAKADQDFNVSRVQNNGQQPGVRQASSSEVSLLGATDASPNNDDCRLMTYAYQYNGIRSCKIVGRESLCQSGLFSAVGEQSPKNHTEKSNSKGHQRYDASSARDNKQHWCVREVSSSELSVLSVKGQSPNNDVKQNRINNAYESMANGSGKIMDSKLNAHTIEEPSSVSQIKTHQDELNVNDSHDNRRQHSNRLKADESSDTMSTSSQSTVSSTGVSLLDAKRSTPNTQRRTSMTENWNKTCNCRRVKFITNSQCSDTSAVKVKFETHQRNDASEELDTDEKSTTAERLLHDGNDVACYCRGQCTLHNTRRIAPCNCQTCLSTYYNWKSNIEDTADDTGASRTESLVTSDSVSRTSVTTSCSVSRTTVSDADVDDKSQCESTAEDVRDEQEVSGQTVLCPNCFRNNHYVQTTKNGVENDSESTDESKVSEDNDNQDEEQRSITDGERISTADSYSDTADRRGQTARKDSQMSTSLKSDVASRCERQVSTEARNVGSHKCCRCHWQHVAILKWRNDDESAGVMKAGDGDTERTDSRTTVTSSTYSHSNKELNVPDSEHVDGDDDDAEIQPVNEQCTVSCNHVEVTSIDLSYFLHLTAR